MRYSAGLFALLMTLTGHGISEVEYRGLGVKLQISAQRMSPAFAALEDTHAVHTEDIQIDSSEHRTPEYLYAGRPETIKIQLPKVQIAAQTGSPINEALQRAHEVFVKSAPLLVGSQRDQIREIATTTAKLKKHFKITPTLLSSHTPSYRRVIHNNREETKAAKSIDIDGVEFFVGGENVATHKGHNTVAMLAAPTLAPAILPRHQEKTVSNEAAQRLSLKGHIVLSDGAVYPGESFNFYIQRMFDGMTQERGLVDPYTGEFEIDVNALRGKITVELRHETGAAIAYGEVNLSQIKDRDLNELKLKLSPTDQISVIGQVLSYESFDDIEVAVEGAVTQVHLDGDTDILNTDRKGQFKDSHIIAGSQMLVSASHKGFWNTIELAESGKPIHPIMHSDRRMQVMMDLLEPYLPKSKIYSIIWGRVSHEGRPLSGATVTLQGYEDIQPLYFNLRIPNPDAERTSEDGYFAFINPPEGLHILKANHKKVKIPYESTIVRAHHTSIARLETAPLKPVTVNIREAFKGSDASVSARVSAPGSSTAWWLSARKNNVVNFYDRSTPMPMDIDAGPEFVSATTFVNRRRTHLEVPLVRKSWLSQIVASHKINILPRTGMVMGYIAEGSHAVDISQKTPDTAIIYFNHRGQVVDGITQGGGFIILNVPHGVSTVSVIDTVKAKSFRTLSLIEHGRLSLVTVPQNFIH